MEKQRKTQENSGKHEKTGKTIGLGKQGETIEKQKKTEENMKTQRKRWETEEKIGKQLKT